MGRKRSAHSPENSTPVGPAPTTTKFRIASFSVSVVPGSEANSKPGEKQEARKRGQGGQGGQGGGEWRLAFDDPLTDLAGIRDLLEEEGVLLDPGDAKGVWDSPAGDDELVIAYGAG